MRAVAERVKDQRHVIGFDTLNEPGEGFLGEELSYRHTEITPEHPEPLRGGPAISVLDALLAARGVPRTVPFLAMERETRKIRESRQEVLNPNGISIWREGASCPFEKAGRLQHRERRHRAGRTILHPS